jgi:hypothetical protein
MKYKIKWRRKTKVVSASGTIWSENKQIFVKDLRQVETSTYFRFKTFHWLTLPSFFSANWFHFFYYFSSLFHTSYIASVVLECIYMPLPILRAISVRKERPWPRNFQNRVLGYAEFNHAIFIKIHWLSGGVSLMKIRSIFSGA